VNNSATDQLLTQIAVVDDRFSGHIRVASAALDTTEVVEYGSATPVATASVIKVPILLTALALAEEGGIDLSTRVTIKSTDIVEGSGFLKLFQAGLEPTLRDLSISMIATSDNTATNLMIDSVGGVEAVNAFCGSLGLGDIRLHNRIDFSLLGDDPEALGTASISDLNRLSQRIANGTAFSPSVSREAEDIMGTQMYLDLVARHYQLNPYANELGKPTQLTVASKTGFFGGIRVDMGIVRWANGGFTYACSAHDSDDLAFSCSAEPAMALGKVGQLLLQHYWPESAGQIPLALGLEV